MGCFSQKGSANSFTDPAFGIAQTSANIMEAVRGVEEIGTSSRPTPRRKWTLNHPSLVHDTMIPSHITLPPAARSDGRCCHNATAELPRKGCLCLFCAQLRAGRHTAIAALHRENLPGVRDMTPGGVGPVGAVPREQAQLEWKTDDTGKNHSSVDIKCIAKIGSS